MVINITLGRAKLDRGMPGRVVRDAASGFAGDDLAAVVCAQAGDPAASVIATAIETADENVNNAVDNGVEKRSNMRLLRRRLLLRAPRLLVCFRRESFGGQSFG
jgi:hypothetical protein